ncbi:DNA polymerase I [Candidatus Albibeggiatoa sp. nov. NOAA]|uniref:DNA polymerase I n=1 Tax=Candidatus Albibeggiatoa sp. nov. NOAA TaxID=3162724 RepID=UPI0032FCD497|nr:DNA polymerase I [Thiotrichaceae bacterium]
MDNSNTLFLVDGSSYLFRAYHALPPLTNAAGVPTGAVFGMTNMLRNLIRDYQPQYVAIVFDTKAKTFRDEMYPEYKANRPPAPDDLVQQIDYAFQIIEAMGFPLIKKDGVEADDVIGTLALQAQQVGMDTIVFTGDKDLAQVVTDKIHLIDTMKNTRLDVQGVKDKFGVAPEQIIDYLTLVGDNADNIKGVDKVGPKTAVKWLAQYKSLDNIIEQSHMIKGKVGENLRNALNYLPLTRRLITIKTDVELEHTPQQLSLCQADNEQLLQLFTELNFKREWVQELQSSDDSAEEVPESNPTNIETQYQTILTQDEFDTWLQRLQQTDCFAFDVETNSLDYLNAELVGLSFSLQSGEAAYVPVAHDYMGAPQQLSRDAVLSSLKPLLENPNVKKVGQNLKFDAHILANYDINLQGIAYDTMLASYVLNSTSKHDMDSLAKQHLGVNTVSFEDIAGKGKKQLTFNQIDLEQAAPYAAEDADITWQLHETLYPQLKQDLLKVYHEIEMPLLPILMRVERNGVKLDTDKLHQHSLELASELQTLEQQAHDLAKKVFNLNSPKQLQKILFEDLQLPVQKKTAKGDPSTSVEVLETLAKEYELPKIILAYRSLSKLKSTYTDALPQQVNAKTGRIHTSYHQAVTVTGRLSSSAPNLQNIPIRTAEGRRIRQAFIPEQGYKLIAADYSQIELRIMAHLSQDEKLLDAFAKGEDIHKATASQVFNTPLENVTKDQRRNAKAVNFGLIYGMQAFGLAQQLNTERSKAQSYIDAYFEQYPKVKHYMENTRDLAKKQGFVETVFGRRLYIPDISSRNYQRKQYAERSAINAPMQGTAADIIKLAMVAVQHWIDEKQLDIRMLMQVHDELVFEVPEDLVEQAQVEIPQQMMQVAHLDVPLLVEAGVGMNWDEAH